VEVLLSIIPEIVAVVLAAAVAVARTTDTKIDDKVAELAQDNTKKINRAVKSLLDEEENEKHADREARRVQEDANR